MYFNIQKDICDKPTGNTISSVQFSRSIMSDSLSPHGLQHTRLPCPSPAPGTCSNSCPSSRWCHPTILSSVVPFSCLQSFQASGSFPMSQLFISGGQNTGASASGDPGSLPVLGRSPGEGNGNPLQYSCLENPLDRGARRATVYRVTKSQTEPND